MSGAFRASDWARIDPAKSGAPPASTAEAFRKERRESFGEIEWTVGRMVRSIVEDGELTMEDRVSSVEVRCHGLKAPGGGALRNSIFESMISAVLVPPAKLVSLKANSRPSMVRKSS